MSVIVALSFLCCSRRDQPEPTREDMTIEAMEPELVVPGTALVITGNGFLPEFAGPTTLKLEGRLAERSVDLSLPVTFVDYGRVEAIWPGYPSDGVFEGTATLLTPAAFDGRVHQSGEHPVRLEIHDRLVPTLEAVDDPVRHVNDRLTVGGDGFLLGGEEGATLAVVEGCFTPEGERDCEPVGPVEVEASPLAPFDRTGVSFPFSPAIAGIHPGRFEGTVSLRNRHQDGEAIEGEGELPIEHPIRTVILESFSPRDVSFGQFVDIAGRGFVGPGPQDPLSSAVTLVELEGLFRLPNDTVIPTTLTLISSFVDGQLVRYVVNEEDELGRAVDVRYTPGVFEGTARPVVEYEDQTERGEPTPVTLGLAPVKQVVWLRFLPTYVESLRHFGLREAERAVADRVVEVVRRDYAGVNLEARTEEPDDYALFAEVEIGGPDPNGIGLLGYDNSPGKDNGNLRLYDRIGGVNAITQQDGYAGYGGVFVESFFVFSAHPGSFVPPGAGEGVSDPAFDELFDPFRPDRGGEEITAEEVEASAPIDGADCPASDRSTQVDCAIFALGNLIGSTVSHELAHSLGLADPGGPNFHSFGNAPNSLMDAGGARPFAERAEIHGLGPGRFCAGEYAYLEEILPDPTPDPVPVRTLCF